MKVTESPGLIVDFALQRSVFKALGLLEPHLSADFSM